MQYSVPQFVEIEDRIIGPLTLKQFLVLLGGALLGFMFWSIFGVGALFFIFTLPTAGLFAFLAFGKFNGKSITANLPTFIKFFTTPRYRVFVRGSASTPIVKKETPLHEAAPEPITEERQSRLKKLAYLLDKKSAEEERLVHSGDLNKQWLNEI